MLIKIGNEVAIRPEAVNAVEYNYDEDQDPPVLLEVTFIVGDIHEYTLDPDLPGVQKLLEALDLDFQ